MEFKIEEIEKSEHGEKNFEYQVKKKHFGIIYLPVVEFYRTNTYSPIGNMFISSLLISVFFSFYWLPIISLGIGALLVLMDYGMSKPFSTSRLEVAEDFIKKELKKETGKNKTIGNKKTIAVYKLQEDGILMEKNV